MLVASIGDTASTHGRFVGLSSLWLLEAGCSDLASLGINYVAHVLVVFHDDILDRNPDSVVALDVILGAGLLGPSGHVGARGIYVFELLALSWHRPVFNLGVLWLSVSDHLLKLAAIVFKESVRVVET